MCGKVLDRWGDHALCCCGGGDRVLRHNAIRNVVCSAVAEFTTVSLNWKNPDFLIPPRPPVPGGTDSELDHGHDPHTSSGGGRHPTNVWVPRGVSGFAEAWDFSVSSLLRTSHITSAAPSVAGVFNEVETRKRTFQDTASQVAALGATFCPLVLKACGGAGGGPRPYAKSSHGFQPSHAPCEACPGTCLGIPTFGLHRVSAATSTGKMCVQSSGGFRR